MKFLVGIRKYELQKDENQAFTSFCRASKAFGLKKVVQPINLDQQKR